jgi:hypothetical protein
MFDDCKEGFVVYYLFIKKMEWNDIDLKVQDVKVLMGLKVYQDGG